MSEAAGREALFSRVPKFIRNCRLNAEPGTAAPAPVSAMILMPEGVLRLKGTGSEIAALCDGKRTIAEIVETLRARFSSPVGGEEIRADVLHFLETLREKRVIDFVVVTEAGVTEAGAPEAGKKSRAK